MNDLSLHVARVPLRMGWKPNRRYAQLRKIYPERPDGKGGKGGTAPCDTWDNVTLHCTVDLYLTRLCTRSHSSTRRRITFQVSRKVAGAFERTDRNVRVTPGSRLRRFQGFKSIFSGLPSMVASNVE